MNKIKNDWALTLPSPEDADENGQILIRGEHYLDPERGGWDYSTQKVSLEIYLLKGLSHHWKRTDEWVSAREIFERKIIQIAGLSEGIAALADDGSVWISHNSTISPKPCEWMRMDDLPGGIRKRFLGG